MNKVFKIENLKNRDADGMIIIQQPHSGRRSVWYATEYDVSDATTRINLYSTRGLTDTSSLKTIDEFLNWNARHLRSQTVIHYNDLDDALLNNNFDVAQAAIILKWAEEGKDEI